MKPEQQFIIPVSALDVGYFNTKYATKTAADKPPQCGLFPSIAPVMQSNQVESIATKEWAAAGSVDTDLSFLSFLELYRTDVPERRMPARGVVEALDVIEHV